MLQQYQSVCRYYIVGLVQFVTTTYIGSFYIDAYHVLRPWSMTLLMGYRLPLYRQVGSHDCRVQRQRSLLALSPIHRLGIIGDIGNDHENVHLVKFLVKLTTSYIQL